MQKRYSGRHGVSSMLLPLLGSALSVRGAHSNVVGSINADLSHPSGLIRSQWTHDKVGEDIAIGPHCVLQVARQAAEERPSLRHAQYPISSNDPDPENHGAVVDAEAATDGVAGADQLRILMARADRVRRSGLLN